LKSRHNTRSQCDEKPQRDEKTGRFLAGNSGNGGRKVGSRNKLATEFLDALAEDFSRHGIKAIERVREDRPDKYLQVISHLLPRHAELDISVSQDLAATVSEFAEAWRIVRGGAPKLIEADVIALLNDRWRVIFDPLQWIWQRRDGKKWNNRSYCVTKGRFASLHPRILRRG
jgi:hypothetical protein